MKEGGKKDMYYYMIGYIIYKILIKNRISSKFIRKKKNYKINVVRELNS